jgi:hypothetical protein
MGATGDPSWYTWTERRSTITQLGLYDVTVKIVRFEASREIAWTVEGQLNLGHVYGYKLEPIGEVTLVTSCYDRSAVEQSWKDGKIFPVIPEGAPRATLGILGRTVAPGRPRPSQLGILCALSPSGRVRVTSHKVGVGGAGGQTGNSGDGLGRGFVWASASERRL